MLERQISLEDKKELEKVIEEVVEKTKTPDSKLINCLKIFPLVGRIHAQSSLTQEEIDNLEKES